MNQLIKNYKIYLEQQLYNKSTVESYVMDMIDFEKYLLTKNNTIENAENIDIYEYINNLQELYNYKNSTIMRKFASFRSFYIYLEDVTGINKVRFEKLKPPKKTNSSLNVIDEKYIDKFISSIGTKTITGLRNKTLYELVWEAGLKTNELTEIKWEDYNEKLSMLVVEGRELNISDDMKDKLNKLKKNYIVNNINSEYIFCKKNGEKLNVRSIQVFTNDYADKIGLKNKITVSTIRNTLIDKEIKQGKPYVEISIKFGIKNISIIQNYANRKEVI